MDTDHELLNCCTLLLRWYYSPQSGC